MTEPPSDPSGQDHTAETGESFQEFQPTFGEFPQEHETPDNQNTQNNSGHDGGDSADDASSGSTDSLPSAKDREFKVMLYLPQSLGKEWELAVTKLELIYQQGGGKASDIEKLRHIYPLIVLVGLSNVEDITAEQFAEFIEAVEYEDKHSSSTGESVSSGVAQMDPIGEKTQPDIDLLSGGRDSAAGASGGSTDSLPSAKDREFKVMLHLPQSLGKEWELAVTKLELIYQQGGGKASDIEKLRHIYPLLVLVGLSNVEDITAEQLKQFMSDIESEDLEECE